MKTVRIPAALKSSNIYKYQVRWSPDGITRQHHSEYLEQFNDDFYRSMKEQIDRCAQARLRITPDELQHEVLEHAIQCKTYVSKFHGRTDVLSKVGTKLIMTELRKYYLFLVGRIYKHKK